MRYRIAWDSTNAPVGLAYGLKDVIFLSRERCVGTNGVDELEHLIVVAMEEPKEKEVQRGGQRRREHEGQRDVHWIEIVLGVERLVPLHVCAV